MVAANTIACGKRRIVCTVVRVPDETNPTAARLAARPSDLVPWADPYIASLVHQLQKEVRRERVSAAPRLRPLSPRFDLDPPAPTFDFEPPGSDWDDRNAPQWPAGDRFAEGRN